MTIVTDPGAMTTSDPSTPGPADAARHEDDALNLKASLPQCVFIGACAVLTFLLGFVWASDENLRHLVGGAAVVLTLFALLAEMVVMRLGITARLWPLVIGVGLASIAVGAEAPGFVTELFGEDYDDAKPLVGVLVVGALVGIVVAVWTLARPRGASPSIRHASAIHNVAVIIGLLVLVAFVLVVVAWQLP